MNLVFFDLDGTLEDSRQDMALSVNRVRSALGLAPFDLEFARSIVNRGMDALTEAAFPELIKSPADTARLRAAYETDYMAHVTDHTVLYPGIQDMLLHLSGKNALALYTNKPEAISRELLRRLGVLDAFGFIIGGDSFKESKPHPGPMDIAEKAIARTKGAVRKRIMCGDTAADMQAASNFAAAAIWCEWGYLSARPDPPGDFTASHPAEIIKIIEEKI